MKEDKTNEEKVEEEVKKKVEKEKTPPAKAPVDEETEKAEKSKNFEKIKEALNKSGFDAIPIEGKDTIRIVKLTDGKIPVDSDSEAKKIQDLIEDKDKKEEDKKE